MKLPLTKPILPDFELLSATNQRAHQRRISGFTLVEVIIVLGLTSILLVVGVTNMLSYVSRQNLSSEVRGIVAVLQDAQSKAMGQQEESRWGIYLVNNPGSQRDSFSIFQVDEELFASTTYTNVPGIELEQKTMRSNVEFVSPDEGTVAIILFNKVSGLPNASTTVILQIVGNAGSQKTIFVSGNGKIDYQ